MKTDGNVNNADSELNRYHGGMSESLDGNISDVSGRSSSVHRTKPICNKCKNHGEVKPLRGHKRYCKYQKCECQFCFLTGQRRLVMAAQTRQKRAQMQDDKLGVPFDHRAPIISPKLPIETIVDLSVHTRPTPEVKPISTLKIDDLLEGDYRKTSLKLIEEFGVSRSVLPFALVIARKAGDFHAAKKLILGAQKLLLERSLKHAHSLLPKGFVRNSGSESLELNQN